MAIIIIMPTHTPVLKTSPMNSHPEKNIENKKIVKAANNDFIFFCF